MNKRPKIKRGAQFNTELRTGVKEVRARRRAWAEKAKANEKIMRKYAST